MFNKKAMMTSPYDRLIGFFIGLMAGVVLGYLIAKGIIPIPYLN